MQTVTLNNSVEMPAVGLGVSRRPPMRPGTPSAPLGAGYRHIDTAAAYGNERRVSEAAHADGLDTGRRGGPEPDAITVEAFGREIPRTERCRRGRAR